MSFATERSPYWSVRTRLDEFAELRRRLTWRHGAEQAERTITGGDARTERDIRAWRDFGRPE